MNKSKDRFQKIGSYLSKYVEKWKMLDKKYEDETVTNQVIAKMRESEYNLQVETENAKKTCEICIQAETGK